MRRLEEERAAAAARREFYTHALSELRLAQSKTARASVEAQQRCACFYLGRLLCFGREGGDKDGRGAGRSPCKPSLQPPLFHLFRLRAIPPSQKNYLGWRWSSWLPRRWRPTTAGLMRTSASSTRRWVRVWGGVGWGGGFAVRMGGFCALGRVSRGRGAARSPAPPRPQLLMQSLMRETPPGSQAAPLVEALERVQGEKAALGAKLEGLRAMVAQVGGGWGCHCLLGGCLHPLPPIDPPPPPSLTHLPCSWRTLTPSGRAGRRASARRCTRRAQGGGTQCRASVVPVERGNGWARQSSMHAHAPLQRTPPPRRHRNHHHTTAAGDPRPHRAEGGAVGVGGGGAGHARPPGGTGERRSRCTAQPPAAPWLPRRTALRVQPLTPAPLPPRPPAQVEALRAAAAAAEQALAPLRGEVEAIEKEVSRGLGEKEG